MINYYLLHPGHWNRRTWIFDNPEDNPSYLRAREYENRGLNPNYDPNAIQATFQKVEVKKDD
jgi:hypothetical protein